MGLLRVVLAARNVGREHRDIAPRRGNPVRVVITLLGALRAAPAAIRILASAACLVAVIHVPICGEEALVAAPGAALLIPDRRLVLPICRGARVVISILVIIQGRALVTIVRAPCVCAVA